MNAAGRARAGLSLVLALIAAASLEPDAAIGSAAASAAAEFAPCAACHGEHGEGMAAAHVPRLAGQAADYLQKQLDNYADGTRDNNVMTNFAKALSEAQRAKLAARYAAMSAPYIRDGATLDANGLARGRQLAYHGDETKRVQACNSCHGVSTGKITVQ